MNDTDRAQWVDNDEGLYNWWINERPRVSLRQFVREHRVVIDNVVNGRRHPHHLRYGERPLSDR